MGFSKQDLLGVAKLIRRDLGMAQGKLTDLIENIARLPDDEAPKEHAICPECGASISPATKERLAEHLANVHGRVPA